MGKSLNVAASLLAASMTVASMTVGGVVKAEETINLLYIDVLSGPFKTLGERGFLGAKFAVDEINGKGGIDGRKLSLVSEDGEFKPDVSQRKATQHLLDGAVHAVLTGNSTAVIKALIPVVERNKVILSVYAGETDSLTGADFSPFLFRSALNVSMKSRATLQAMKDVKFKKVYLINQDYVYGHSVSKAVKKSLEEFRPGWELVGDVFAPLATKDFAPYIQKILASGSDVVFTANFGPDLSIFLSQAEQFGLDIPIGAMNLSDPLALAEIGSAAVGNTTSEIYMVGIDTPENKDFVERWHAKFGESEYPWPDYSIGKAYNMVKFLAAAIDKADSVEADAIIKAWEGMTFKGIVGTQVMRACDHQIQSPAAYAKITDEPSKYYVGPAAYPVKQIPAELVSVPPSETENPRCM